MENNDGALKAGMSAEANLQIKSIGQVLAIPSSSIVDKDGETYVFQVAGKVVKMIQVKTGISSNTETAIISGIDQNSEIVTVNAQMLMDGDTIK